MSEIRTPFETDFTLRYALALNARHRHLYSKMRMIFTGLNLLAGMAAVVTLITLWPWLAGFIGLLVCFVSVLDLLIAPGDKVYTFGDMQRRWSELQSNLHALDAAERDRQINRLLNEPHPIIDGLRAVAYNDACLQTGVAAEQHSTTNRWARMLATIS